MIHDNFRISGTGEALLDFNDLVGVQLKNDNVHGFDTKRCEVLLSMTNVPDEDVLDTVLETAPFLRGIETSDGLYLQATASCSRLDQLVRRHVEQQKIRNRNTSFIVRNEDRSLLGKASWKGNPRGNPEVNAQETSSKGQCSR